VYVVATGPPASGKTTLSRALARLLDLPLLAKDDYKQRLLDDVPVESVEESRLAGRRAVQTMLSSARDAGRGVLDSVWVERGRAIRELTSLQAVAEVVEVFCRCDVDTMRRRYLERAPTKGPGHFDVERDEAELWPPEALGPLAGPWSVIEVDTSVAVDVSALASRIRRTRSHR
jgi:predicted kinase